MVRSDTLVYRADRLEMVGTLYRQGERSRPQAGILVFPEALGPGPNVHGRARQLAELGYAALVCDLHGGALLLDDIPTVMTLVGPLQASAAGLRARANGAFDALRSHEAVDKSRIGAIGFCIGGTLALELGRSGAEVRCIVGFHAGLSTPAPADAGAIRGEVLICTGADDPSVDLAQRVAFEHEMRAGGGAWTMHVYGGVVHAFTDRDADRLLRPDFARYDEHADRRSWRAMLDLLEENLL